MPEFKIQERKVFNNNKAKEDRAGGGVYNWPKQRRREEDKVYVTLNHLFHIRKRNFTNEFHINSMRLLYYNL